LWFRGSPFVLSILDALDDYEAGRLGDVRDLEAPFLFYLRVAIAERRAWERYCIEEIQSG
jgi:hypothetical protein